MPSQASSKPPFPQGCIAARDIIDEKPKPGHMVNVVALVKDCRLPVPTSGKDHKCTLTLFDLSTQDGSCDLVLIIFRPAQQMLQVGPGDVIVIQGARVQRYQSNPLSLITHNSTSLHVYQAASIPHYPESPRPALKPDPRHPDSRPLAQAEAYVSWLYHSINKDCVPDQREFLMRAEQSLNLKDKFSRLENVKQDKFYDLVVQVVREPYDLLDKVNVWVTDYTENQAFYHMTSDGSNSMSDGKDGDPYGYTTGKSGNASQASNARFEGPLGKRCMQLTCFETHGAVVRNHVRQGTYVRLRNIQVKYGHNANNLEGFLRQDRDAAPSKIQVEVLDPTDAENIDPNLKQLIRRKRDYEKERKSEIRRVSSGSAIGSKRPAANELGGKMNGKKRRALRRAAVETKTTHDEEGVADEAALALNPNVRCDNIDQPRSTFKTVLERVHYQTSANRSPLDIQLPFTCANYRINARVVDFYPPKLQDFACPRRISEYDVLSDCSSSMSQSDDEMGTQEGPSGRQTWEWRFALCLEEVAVATAPGKRKADNQESVWVFVDNGDAQLLTDLDACDLRKDPTTLSILRERLFILWGDLEELKTKQSKGSKPKASTPKPKDDPPPDSSDFEDNKSQANGKTISGDGQGTPKPGASVGNLPFSCCVRQYGVRVSESNPNKANAGEGKRWERAFGLFGTKVTYA